MISVKICGITNESDLAQVVEAGADMVGFVVVETSPRYVDFDAAQALILKAAELGVEPWVVATLAVPWLNKLVDETPEIGAVQLHAFFASQEARLREGGVWAGGTVRTEAGLIWSATEAALTALADA